MSHRNLLSLTKCLLLFSLFEPLDAEERRIMQEHPVTGENICKPLKSLRRILPVIRHHHEKMDGSGYPDGLRGEAVPLKARILQVADVYDALTTDRPYRGALSKSFQDSHRHRYCVPRCVPRLVLLNFVKPDIGSDKRLPLPVGPRCARLAAQWRASPDAPARRLTIAR